MDVCSIKARETPKASPDCVSSSLNRKLLLKCRQLFFSFKHFVYLCINSWLMTHLYKWLVIGTLQIHLNTVSKSCSRNRPLMYDFSFSRRIVFNVSFDSFVKHTYQHCSVPLHLWFHNCLRERESFWDFRQSLVAFVWWYSMTRNPEFTRMLTVYVGCGLVQVSWELVGWSDSSVCWLF